MQPGSGCSLHRETVIKNEPNPLLQKKAEKLKVFGKLGNVYQAIVKFWESCVLVNHSFIVTLELSGLWIC